MLVVKTSEYGKKVMSPSYFILAMAINHTYCTLNIWHMIIQHPYGRCMKFLIFEKGGHMYHIYMKYSCPSVHLSIMEGQRKRFDLETQGTVSLAVERKKLEIGMYCECLSRHQLQAQTLAYWTDCT